MDHDIQDHSRGKRSSCRSWSTPSFSEDSGKTDFSSFYTDTKCRSRSPENCDESARKSQEKCKRGRSIPSETDDRASSPRDKMSSSKEDSGYGDELENCPGASCGDQKSKPTHCDRCPQPAKQDIPKRRRSRGSRGKKDKAKKLPWVPPPLPEHLRPVPKITRIEFPSLGGRNPPCPLQNRFQNDGSFLEVFRQKMQADSAVQQSGEAGHSSGADVEKFTAVVDEPFVMKRRLSKPLKTGMVQKPKRRLDACDPEARVKDSWSLYMKEVQKYRANKCVNNERACRPLMK